MIRVGLAVAIVVAGSAGAAAGPLDGQWGLSREDCQSAGTRDRVPLTIVGDRMDFRESVCEIAEIKPIGTQDLAWPVERSCGGEGEKWTV